MGRLKRLLGHVRYRLFTLTNQYIVFILTLLLLLGFGSACFGMSRLSVSLVDAQAEHYAQVAVKTLNAARQLYSKNVVERVKGIDAVTVGAEYHEVAGGIPNPATYTIELGDRLTNKTEGMVFRLYSDYPFPHRKETGGPRDQFEQDALAYLRQNPDSHFQIKEKFNDRFVFRYTEAVRMEPSCIECHNTIANSAKRNWRVGDVRGVVEIIQPLDSILLIASGGLKNIALALTVIIGLAIAGIMAVVNRLKHVNQELEEKVAQRTQELQKLATTDALTGLANRRYFDEVMAQALIDHAQWQQPLSLILCDVDHFKQYNDTYGHQTGDSCLHAIAQVLQQYTQGEQLLAGRFGGEEFIILLVNQTSEEAIAFAQDLRQGIHRLKLEHCTSSTAACVTISMGITTMMPTTTTTQAELIRVADQALYKAKNMGRDRHVFLTFETAV